MINLDLTLVGWVHTAACVVAMVAFVPIMLSRKGGARHRASGRVYAVAYIVVCITALGIYRGQRFFLPHWLAVGGLAVLAVGFLAARLKPQGWRYIHLVAMLLSAYNLCGGAVNEAYLRIRPLRELAGPRVLASPVVGITHGVVMLVFVALIVGYVTLSMSSRTRRPRVASVTPP